jgi:hypothetical protein
MTTKKKLRRGLPELSALFLRSRLPSQPVSDAIKSAQLVCVSFVSFDNTFQFQDIPGAARTIRSGFEQVHLLSLTQSQIKEMMALQCGAPRNGSVDPNRKSLAVLLEPSLNKVKKDDAIFGLLDHCVLVVGAHLPDLQQAYQWLRPVLATHPDLICSLLITGPGARASWEFVYERFSEIVSQFLFHDLGFLGWIDHEDRQLNLEILREESKGSLKLATRARLFDAALTSPNVA